MLSLGATVIQIAGIMMSSMKYGALREAARNVLLCIGPYDSASKFLMSEMSVGLERAGWNVTFRKEKFITKNFYSNILLFETKLRSLE
jgi:hypothetical protein